MRMGRSVTSVKVSLSDQRIKKWTPGHGSCFIAIGGSKILSSAQLYKKCLGIHRAIPYRGNQSIQRMVGIFWSPSWYKRAIICAESDSVNPNTVARWKENHPNLRYGSTWHILPLRNNPFLSHPSGSYISSEIWHIQRWRTFQGVHNYEFVTQHGRKWLNIPRHWQSCESPAI